VLNLGSSGNIEMKLSAALKWALPVWFVAMLAVAASMFLTGFFDEVGRTETLKRFVAVVVVTFPLVAWIIKRTADDILWWRQLREKGRLERSEDDQ